MKESFEMAISVIGFFVGAIVVLAGLVSFACLILILVVK